MAQYLKFIGAGFVIFVLIIVSRNFEIGSKQESTISPVWGAFIIMLHRMHCIRCRLLLQ